MNNESIKQIARDILQPAFDEIIDSCCSIYSAIASNLPDSIPEPKKKELIENLFKQQQSAIIASIRAGVPADFEAKIKEAVNG